MSFPLAVLIIYDIFKNKSDTDIKNLNLSFNFLKQI